MASLKATTIEDQNQQSGDVTTSDDTPNSTENPQSSMEDSKFVGETTPSSKSEGQTRRTISPCDTIDTGVARHGKGEDRKSLNNPGGRNAIGATPRGKVQNQPSKSASDESFTLRVAPTAEAVNQTPRDIPHGPFEIVATPIGDAENQTPRNSPHGPFEIGATPIGDAENQTPRDIPHGPFEIGATPIGEVKNQTTGRTTGNVPTPICIKGNIAMQWIVMTMVVAAEMQGGKILMKVTRPILDE